MKSCGWETYHHFDHVSVITLPFLCHTWKIMMFCLCLVAKMMLVLVFDDSGVRASLHAPQLIRSRLIPWNPELKMKINSFWSMKKWKQWIYLLWIIFKIVFLCLWNFIHMFSEKSLCFHFSVSRIEDMERIPHSFVEEASYIPFFLFKNEKD